MAISRLELSVEILIGTLLSSQASGTQQEQYSHLGVCISPEQLGVGLVHSQSIGPSQVVVDEHAPIRAIHSRSL